MEAAQLRVFVHIMKNAICNESMNEELAL